MRSWVRKLKRARLVRCFSFVLWFTLCKCLTFYLYACVRARSCVCAYGALGRPCCRAPSVPLGPICLPVINSSGLTMRHFTALFGLTKYLLSLSLFLCQQYIGKQYLSRGDVLFCASLREACCSWAMSKNGCLFDLKGPGTFWVRVPALNIFSWRTYLVEETIVPGMMASMKKVRSSTEISF